MNCVTTLLSSIETYSKVNRFSSLKKYISLKELVNKYGLENAATNNVRIKEILLFLNTPCGLYLRDDTFFTKSGIINLPPTKRTHWVMFINECYFDSYGCPTPLSITILIKKGIYS